MKERFYLLSSIKNKNTLNYLIDINEKIKMWTVGFEPTPFRNRALIYRLRPLGHVHLYFYLTLFIIHNSCYYSHYITLKILNICYQTNTFCKLIYHSIMLYTKYKTIYHNDSLIRALNN